MDPCPLWYSMLKNLFHSLAKSVYSDKMFSGTPFERYEKRQQLAKSNLFP